MDHAKRIDLIAKLASEPEPQIVPIEEFFDGNDDLGSIGCNLADHPGMEAFQSAFRKIAARDDVVAVYAQITESDPGFEAWPFADTVHIVGHASVVTLGPLLKHLQPDEIASIDGPKLPEALVRLHKEPVVTVWWD